MGGWVLRNEPHPGVAKGLAFYQIASATADWVMWIWLADDGIFSSGRVTVVLAIVTHYLLGFLLLRAIPARRPRRGARLGPRRGDVMASRVESPPHFSTEVRERRLRLMTWFVRLAGMYNASAVIVLVTPGALDLVGVREPYSPFWTWLPGLTGLFAGIVLLLSSMNLPLLAAFPYWNEIIRLIFVITTVSMSFGSDATFFALLAVGDVPLALGTILGLPWALGRTHRELLTNRLAA